MKHDTFSISRLGQMLKINITENFQSMLMQFIVMTGITYLAIGLTCYLQFNSCYSIEYPRYSDRTSDPMWGSLLGLFSVLIVGFGALSASRSAAFMSDKPHRLITLMTPATQLEKYLARLIIHNIAFIVLFTAMFILGDLIRTGVAAALYPDCNCIRPMLGMLGTITFEWEVAISYTASVLCVLSLYTLGSYIWPRHSFIITSVAAGALSLFATTVLTVLGSWLFDYGYYYPRTDMFDRLHVLWIIQGVFILFNWTLAYFRFREDEIVKRW